MGFNRQSKHSSYFSSNNLIYQAYITPLKSCTINWILRWFEKSPMSCWCYIYCVAYSGLDKIIEKEKRHMLIFLGGIGGKNKALNNKNVIRFSFALYIFLIQIQNWTMYNVALIHKRLHSWIVFHLYIPYLSVWIWLFIKSSHKITKTRYRAVRTHVHLLVLHCTTTWRQPGLIWGCLDFIVIRTN